MALNSDLIVVDEDYSAASKAMSEYCVFLNKAVHNYVLTMDAILNDAVKDQIISKKLKKLVDEVRPLVSAIDTLKGDLSANLSAFTSEIDEADKFLY